MSKIKTLTQLQDALDSEMGWRVKEIADFKNVSKSNGATRNTFIRAGVALVYAHWEGFIKRSSESYLNYVENQGLIYRELKTCFAVFGLKGKLWTLVEGRKANPNIDALDFVFLEMDRPAKMAMSSAINTEANLKSPVFSNIAASLAIDTSKYETRFNLIDESLVKRRNIIAHGEYLDLALDDFLVLADDVIQLMRDYKTDVENAASLKHYKRPTPLLATPRVE